MKRKDIFNNLIDNKIVARRANTTSFRLRFGNLYISSPCSKGVTESRSNLNVSFVTLIVIFTLANL
jgi:hypothetical protein